MFFLSLFISLGDGHSFVTRLVHIDAEQANSILQQNGKRLVLFCYFTLKHLNSLLSVSLLIIFTVTFITVLLMGRPNPLRLVTTYNTQWTTAKTTSVSCLYFFFPHIFCFTFIFMKLLLKILKLRNTSIYSWILISVLSSLFFQTVARLSLWRWRRIRSRYVNTNNVKSFAAWTSSCVYVCSVGCCYRFPAYQSYVALNQEHKRPNGAAIDPHF